MTPNADEKCSPSPVAASCAPGMDNEDTSWLFFRYSIHFAASYDWAANGWPSHREQQKELIDNIGNYLLLCETVNKRIQNDYITHKVPEYKAIIMKDILSFLVTIQTTF